MKNNPFTGKSTRTKIFTVITVLSIVLLLVLNLFVTNFIVFGNAYIDLTPEGLYTVRDRMFDACEKVFYTEDGKLRDPGIKITFCDDPDNLISNTTTRMIYYMAVALSKRFDNCEVETVNVNMTPTAVAQYKTTSLTQIDSDDVIVSYGQRYSITSAEKFWHIGSDNVVYAFDGEYKLASILLSLTLVNKPVAYFVTDHGTTTYFDKDDPTKVATPELGTFVDLLRERGLEVKNLNIAKDVIEKAEQESLAAGKVVEPSIPDDCVLLIINDPKEDFDCDESKLSQFAYVSETEVLDRFMASSHGSIMMTMDYKNEKDLPNLEDFLNEWGMKLTDTRVSDDKNHIKVSGDDSDHTTIIADYDLEEGTYANSIYGEFAAMSTSPRVVISDTGTIVSSDGEAVNSNEAGSSDTSRIFAPFLYSSPSSVSYGKNVYGDEVVYNATNAVGKQILAAVGGRQTIDRETGENTYSYVFCAASASFFTDSLIGNASYANYDVVSALVQNIARLETHADSSLGGLSMNNDNDSFGGKMFVDASIKDDADATNKKHTFGTVDLVIITIAIVIIPVAIAVTGVVICLKRKYL